MPVTFEHRPVEKPKHNRNKPLRRHISNLTPKEDKRLKERSNGVCEKCDSQRADKPKKINHKRSGPTQRQLGSISQKVREEVRERSGRICEVRVRCVGAHAHQMAHITGRKQIEHRTTAQDLLHSCVPCHKWLDETPEGIKFKRGLRYEESS